MRSRTTRSRLYETVTRRALEVTGVEAVESSARSDAYAAYAAHVAALPPGVARIAHAGDAHDVSALLKADGVLDDVVRGLLV